MYLSTKTQQSLARYGHDVCERAAAMSSEVSTLGAKLEELVAMAPQGKTKVDSPSRLDLAQAAGDEYVKAKANDEAKRLAKEQRDAERAEAAKKARAQRLAERAALRAEWAALDVTFRGQEDTLAVAFREVHGKYVGAITTIEYLRADLESNASYALVRDVADYQVAAFTIDVAEDFLKRNLEARAAGADGLSWLKREVDTMIRRVVEHARYSGRSDNRRQTEAATYAKVAEALDFVLRWKTNEAEKAAAGVAS